MADAREALQDELEYRVRTAAALAKGGHSINGEVAAGKQRIDSILAEFDVTPRGMSNIFAGEADAEKPSIPSVEDVAQVLNAPVGFRWSDNPEGYRAHQARAILALFPGRTEAEVTR